MLENLVAHNGVKCTIFKGQAENIEFRVGCVGDLPIAKAQESGQVMRLTGWLTDKSQKKEGSAFTNNKIWLLYGDRPKPS